MERGVAHRAPPSGRWVYDRGGKAPVERLPPLDARCIIAIKSPGGALYYSGKSPRGALYYSGKSSGGALYYSDSIAWRCRNIRATTSAAGCAVWRCRNIRATTSAAGCAV
jgi:hypothetical protein